jgi:VIT1/CCC1 family predicted Fe2+/Mn2+ transporter
MKESFKTGMSFGFTSAIITTLGMIIGLYKTINSMAVIIAGIVTIAIADSFSDALGIHISEESSKRNGQKAIWEATITTFLTKLIIAILFIIPFFFLDINTSILISLIIGFIAIAIFSYYLAISRGEKPLYPIIEHLAIAAIVVGLTWFIGKGINFYFLN